MQNQNQKQKLYDRRGFLALSAAGLTTAALGLAGCGGSGGSSDSGSAAGPAADGAPQKHLFKIASVGTSATSVEVVSIGLKKGFFEEENIEVENVGDLAIPATSPALLQGQITVAALMTSNGIALADKGGDIIEVATFQSTTKEVPHMIFVVAKDSPIKRGSDLVGKKVGVPALDGCNSGFPIEYVRQDGVENPKDAFTFVVTPGELTIEALLKGEYDVAGLHGLAVDDVAKLYPDVRILFTDFDILGTDGGDISWWVKNSLAKENPDAVRAFVSAVAKTQNWINENPEEAKELYVKEIHSDINELLFAVRPLVQNALVRPSTLQVWIDILSADDSFDEKLTRQWTVDELYTNEFNPFA
jgi:ABC-type nitrate/sulfonate/bicarbonate transport system substrate-binding protein